MLKLRRPKIEDLPDIHQVADKYDFVLPTQFQHAAVVEHENRVIAFGLLREIIEAIIVVDGKDRVKVESIKHLIEVGKRDARELGYNEIHTFIDNPDFADILIEHFGFRRVAGEFLLLKLEKDNGQ